MKIMPVYVAQLGAKHLTDRLLQEKGIADSNRDTQLRRSILAQILPDVAEDVKVKPLNDEEFKAELKKEQEKQSALIGSLSGKFAEKDKEIEELKKEIEALKAPQTEEVQSKPKGRPRKVI